MHDYDSTTANRGSNRKFVRKSAADVANDVPNDSGPPATISYPFNPGSGFDLKQLEAIARQQYNSEGNDNYHEGNIDIVHTASGGVNKKYPDPSLDSDQTVFYVKANGATIDYSVDYEDGSGDVLSKGLIVIENGNFRITNSGNGFDGVIIITAGSDTSAALPCTDGAATGCYTNTGNKTVKGFVIAGNTMKIGGTVDPFSVIGDYNQRPGFYNMALWSWRECYSVNCS